MQIVQWLFDHNSAVIGNAVIRVEPGEIADIEAMHVLIDGQSGHFGLSVRLVKSGVGDPVIKTDRHGIRRAESQFGFEPMGQIKQMVRYYSVHVNRD